MLTWLTPICALKLFDSWADTKAPTIPRHSYTQNTKVKAAGKTVDGGLSFIICHSSKMSLCSVTSQNSCTQEMAATCAQNVRDTSRNYKSLIRPSCLVAFLEVRAGHNLQQRKIKEHGLDFMGLTQPSWVGNKIYCLPIWLWSQFYEFSGRNWVRWLSRCERVGVSKGSAKSVWVVQSKYWRLPVTCFVFQSNSEHASV